LLKVRQQVRQSEQAIVAAGRWMRKLVWRLLSGLLLAFAVPARGAEISCAHKWESSLKEIYGIGYLGKNYVQASDDWPENTEPPFGTCITLKLHGQIEKGDFDKLFAVYKQSHPFIKDITLISPGGNVREAIRIGEFLRKYLISAHPDTSMPLSCLLDGNCPLSEDKVCASACALIWIGAPERWGAVGVHRPRIVDPEFKNLPFSEAQQVYSEALTLTTKYLERMEAPREFIELNTATSSTDIHWIGKEKTEAYSRSPSFAEWIAASCGSILSAYEKSKLDELWSIPQENRTETGELLVKLLSEKRDKKKRCERELVFKSRQKIPLSAAAGERCDAKDCIANKDRSRLAPSPN
jgi:hypothetical protein